MKKISKTVKLGGRDLTLTTGEFAEQADASVMAQYGDTVVFATVASSDLREDLGYFPLSMEYQERLSAGGRIKGSRWVKRSGRPTDDEILNGRLIDRSIRPLFPKGYQKDVQIIVYVLSVDGENNPADVAGIAVSAAVEISKHPWNGPVSIVRIGQEDGKFITNPTDAQSESSDMDLVVSSTKDAIVMIEAASQEVSEKDVLDGIAHAQKESKTVLKLIADLAKEAGVKKEKFEAKKVSSDLEKHVKKLADKELSEMIKNFTNQADLFSKLDEIKAAATEEVEDEEKKMAADLVEKIFTKKMKELVLSGKRIDGRKHDEIRTLSSMVGFLPRTHGSAMFKRGSTQALTVATLGSPSNTQLLESAEGEEEKRYIHHYSMPPFSTGETGRVGSPSRREIGHGALAERALTPVIPTESEFPYTVHVVTEIMSSNGSTSMASTCGSTLSLMDAGVPLKSPVSGIAMGLVVEDEKNFAVLSDIMGLEDFNGDMDFKVTGTEKGITAMQMDVKTLQLTLPILKKAIAQAKEGRAFILESMLKTIKEPRKTVSKYAPKIITIKIDPTKIGEVIGPGGKTIKGIIANTGAEVDVDDDGTVTISAVDQTAVDTAKETVENIVKEVQAGEIYEGKVVRIENFGAFVNILPGKDGMVHVSDMAEEYVSNPSDIVQMDQDVTVRVKEIDNMGRINLSMILDPSKDKPKEDRRSGNGGGRDDRRHGGGRRDFNRNDRNDRRGGNGGGRRDFKRGGGRGFDRRDRKDDKGASAGPHFPASRLVSSGKKRFDR